jgi:hypothetical protein
MHPRRRHTGGKGERRPEETNLKPLPTQKHRVSSDESRLLRWAKAHPRLWAIIATLIVLPLIVGLAALMGAENMREFTNPRTGQVSPYWWLKPAAMTAIILFAWWRQRARTKH